LAVALLDNTVKVFFADTLKFFLSLYGHKLPVMSLDISSDSTLLISGSADKNIKIWGLDFGDCHRSLLAHEDSVMSVRREGARESRDARERERERAKLTLMRTAGAICAWHTLLLFVQ